MVKIRNGDRVVSVGPQTAKILKRRGWTEVVPEAPKASAPKPVAKPRRKKA